MIADVNLKAGLEPDETYDVDQSRRLSEETLDRVLDYVMESNPGAVIAAMGEHSRYQPLPDGFDPGSMDVIESGSGYDLLPVDRRDAAIDAWSEVHDVGAARFAITSRDPALGEVTVYLVDARHRYGCYFSIVVADGGFKLPAEVLVPVRDPTRMGRVRKDAVSVFIDVEDDAVELLGFERDELADKRSLDYIHPDDRDRAIDCWFAMLGDPGGMRSARLRHLRKDGTWLWVDIANRNMLDEAEGCVVADIIDVSDEMEAQEALREREQILARLTEALPLGVIQLDAERSVVFANQWFYDMTGSEADAPLSETFATVEHKDRAVLERAVEEVLDEGTDQEVRVLMHAEDGGEDRFMQIGFRALTSEAGEVTGAVAYVEDVTEATLREAALTERASVDALTGCANRASTMDALEDMLDSDLHARSGTALIFFDVDDLKGINDQFGHAIGDAVLEVVAKRAKNAIRDHDVLGRIGGDEFLALSPAISTESRAMAIARRMANLVNRPVLCEAGTVDVQISVGVVWCDDQRVKAGWLVDQADRVMYESKNHGGLPVGRHATP